jgi:hypothetical protein
MTLRPIRHRQKLFEEIRKRWEATIAPFPLLGYSRPHTRRAALAARVRLLSGSTRHLKGFEPLYRNPCSGFAQDLCPPALKLQPPKTKTAPPAAAMAMAQRGEGREPRWLSWLRTVHSRVSGLNS